MMGRYSRCTGDQMGDVRTGRAIRQSPLRGIKERKRLLPRPRSYFESLSTSGPVLRGRVNVGLDASVGDEFVVAVLGG